MGAMKNFLFTKKAWHKKIVDKIPFRKKAVEEITDINTRRVKDWIASSGMSKIETEEFTQKFLKLPLSEAQYSLLLKEYDEFPKSKKKAEELVYYLSWASSFHEKKKLEALTHLKFVKEQRGRDSTVYRKFLKSRQKFKKYENKKFEKFYKELEKTENTSGDELIQLARHKAREARESFEKLSYSCSAKVKTDDNALASARFQKFAMVVAPISTASMFTIANHEEFVDAYNIGDHEKMQTWVKKLGYEVVLMSGLNMILAKVMSEPTGTYFSKVWKGVLSDTAFISLDSLIYGKIFSASNEKLEQRFDQLKSDPEYHKMLAEMDVLLEKGNAYQEFKDKMFDQVRKVLPLGEKDSDSLIDLSEISKDDMEKPEVKNAILKAITIQMYEEDKGVEEDALASLIHTGSKGEDRFFFFMEVAPLYHSLNVGVAALIYNTICMGRDNPAKAFRNAAMIYAAWSFGYNFFEFSARQHQIGQ
jgi:hypothetical protein